MQVNSAQDYLTNVKRRLVARTYHTIPQPQSRRYNYVHISAMANGARQSERFVAPFQGANGGASGGATYTSFCCLSNGQTGAPGVFSILNTTQVSRANVIPPMSVSATRIIS